MKKFVSVLAMLAIVASAGCGSGGSAALTPSPSQVAVAPVDCDGLAAAMELGADYQMVGSLSYTMTSDSFWMGDSSTIGVGFTYYLEAVENNDISEASAPSPATTEMLPMLAPSTLRPRASSTTLTYGYNSECN